MDKDSISHRLSNFIDKSTDWFYTLDVCDALDLTDPKDVKNVRVQLNILANDGRFLQRHPKTPGKWLHINRKKPAMMDFDTVDPKSAVECYLPFHLEDYFKVFPGNVIVYSGVSNYGKTELMLMTAYMNQHTDGVYFNTDADAPEMLERIHAYQPHDAWRTKFPRKVKSEEIPEMIDHFYANEFIFVDYLKVLKDYFEISALIEACGQATKKGVCFIALQKNKGVDWGRGGQQTLDLSRFYCNLDPGPADVDRTNSHTYTTTELKVIKCKMLKDQHYNPNGWKFVYRMVYDKGNIPTYKMIYEPPEYTRFNNVRKLAEFQAKPKPQQIIEVNPDEEGTPW